MKEVWKPTLTSGAQKTYSGYTDNFMEGKPDMPPTNSQPTNPERSETKPVSAEAHALAERAALEKLLNNPKTPIEVKRQLEALIKETAQKNPRKPNQEVRQEAEKSEPVIADKKVADMIAKYNQGQEKSQSKEEAGRGQDQLRRGLSERIQELYKEQEILMHEPNAITDDGRLTPEVAAKIEEINERIEQIQGFFSTQEVVSRDPEINALVKESNDFINGIVGRGLNKKDANNLTDFSKLTEGEKKRRGELVERIKAAIDNTGPIDTSQFDSGILFAARNFTELREQLISDILFKSFGDETETNRYEITLYAASNLDTLLGFLSVDDKARYKQLFSLRTAAEYFQTMNAAIIKGNFSHFEDSAQNINYQHFENMRDIGGSGLAMRLYEQAYKDVLASDKRVMQDKIAWVRDFAETTFRKMNEAGLINSQYSQFRKDSKMEEWEIQRALATGRTFLNITLRAAESIATGRVPGDRRRYASEPQEDMVRILNWNEWLLKKFDLGGGAEGRHGKEFLDMSTDRFHDFLKYKGTKLDEEDRNRNRITEFGGVNVRKMEDGGQYKTSGVFSSWRLENMAFDQVYFSLDGQKTSVQQFMDKELKVEDLSKDLLGELKKREILVEGENNDLLLFKGSGKATVLEVTKALRDKIKEKGERRRNEDPSKWVNPEDQELYKELLMPVVNNLNYGLSMLIKNGDFGSPDNSLGYLLRKEIWKKIARTNTPIMIDYLTDIQYEKDTPEAEKAKNLETIRKEEVPEWSDAQWQEFKKKVLLKFEGTIGERSGEKPVIIEELTADEKKLEEAIRREGEKLAPHLADIVFPYTPFMNDMPFENFHYDVTGQTFYKRRTVSDLGGYNKGQQAFTKILNNPGGIPAKDAIAAMGEIVEGVQGPEGPRAGMEANFPTFSALIDVVTTDPFKRQAILKILLEATRTETSIAQRWAGIKADSFTEAEAGNLVDDATRAGILNPELARYLKKKKKLTFFTGILWMLFRDIFFVVGPTSFIKEFVGTVKEK